MALVLVAGCASPPAPAPSSPATAAPAAIALAGSPESTCASFSGKKILASAIGFPGGDAILDSAQWLAPSPLSVAEGAPTPAAGIRSPLPARCRVLGRIAPLDPSAPFVHFQVNLPAQWNGRSVPYRGGGFNGTLITGEGLLPADRYDQPVPLAQGYVTYGTDSGHQNRAGEPPQKFALDDEALLNFAHASYKKVRDVAVVVMRVDHVGTGAPANADLFAALVARVEQGRAPAGLVLVEQEAKPLFAVKRSRPLCEWPRFPHYRGGDIDAAGSFACAP